MGGSSDDSGVSTSESNEIQGNIVPVVARKSAPPKEADVTNDTSTFIAATTDETLGGAGNQLMARRAAAANTADDKEQAPAKELRRDSKGFENFDDYFDSDGNDTTINTAGEKTLDESVE